MPTKIKYYKWLCEYCTAMCETAVQCYVHEREMHVAERKTATTGDSDLHALEQICDRITSDSAANNNADLLMQYERVCLAILEKVNGTLKAAKEVETEMLEQSSSLKTTEIKTSTRSEDETHAVLLSSVEMTSIEDAIDKVSSNHKLADTAQPMKCPQCKFITSKADSLKKHIGKRHAPPKQGWPTFMCETCAKIFLSAADLRRHELWHSDVRPYACTQCESRFKRADQLKLHARNVHL
jgi:hypothetical protein